MTGLRSVQFFDNDTLMWSSNASYTAIPAQYVIAIYNEGFMLIDYMAETTIEVRNDMYVPRQLLIASHLQNLVCSCVIPLTERYLLVGTNGHLCVYNLLSQCIQTSVAHLNVTHLLPFKACPAGSIVPLDSPAHTQAYQHPSHDIQVIAVSADALAVCWNVAIGSNGEFIGLSPAFAFANGPCCKGALTDAAFSAELQTLYLLSQGKTVTVIDASGAAGAREAASNATLTGLGCTESLPASAAKSVTVSGASLLGLSEPWVPQLSADSVPVVCGVSAWSGGEAQTDAVSVVDLKEARVRDVLTHAMLPELFKNRQQYTALRVKRSAHSHVCACRLAHR